jgi:hypothetical protein
MVGAIAPQLGVDRKAAPFTHRAWSPDHPSGKSALSSAGLPISGSAGTPD